VKNSQLIMNFILYVAHLITDVQNLYIKYTKTIHTCGVVHIDIIWCECGNVYILLDLILCLMLHVKIILCAFCAMSRTLSVC